VSRGLGWLQRAILATLEEVGPARSAASGTARTLPPGVYDLHHSRRLLAARHGKTAGRLIDETFRTSFSRAVHRLVARGALLGCDGDGQPLPPRQRRVGGRRQRLRFVRRPEGHPPVPPV
jgi:hypothetical protein